MSKVLMTAGYGNQKPEDFVERLKDAGVTVVLDVRRKGSKSWNGKYNHGSFASGMAMLMRDAGILYGTWPVFGNAFDVLSAYSAWLAKSRSTQILDLSNRIGERPQAVFCLLCAERDAHKDGVVNCHRVYVADALVKLLGPEWTTVHL